MKTPIGKMIVGAQAVVVLAGSLAAAQAPVKTESAVPPAGFKIEFIDRSKLPDVPVPAGYEEGYLPKLSEIDIKEVEQFAKNSYEDLKDLLDMAAKVTDYWEKRTLLKGGIDEIIKKSKPLKTELLMRNVLERAVIMVNVIDAEVQNDPKRKGIVDQEVRLLKESIRVSMRYWEPYFKHVNGQTLQANVDLAKINYRQFGVRYANLLWSVANSIFDASAEYKLRLESLKLLMWDLYRDENKLELNQAGAIAKIYNFVKTVPDTATWSDDQYVERVKLLRIIRKEAFERLGPNPDYSPQENAVRQADAAAEASRPKSLAYDLDAYKKALGHYNAKTNCYTSINDADAQKIAKMSLEGTLVIDTFIRLYDITCNLSKALDLSTADVRREIDIPGFVATLAHYNARTNCYNSINYEQAFELATMSNKGSINIGEFKELYDKSCNYRSALTLATRR